MNPGADPWRPDPRASFRWRDGERTIVYGPDARQAGGDLLGDGFTLLSTTRALDAWPGLAERAGAVHEVGPGQVDALAGALRESIVGDRLLAFGGGRVIDTAKALAAARGGSAEVIAVPTTLSGAEMTAVHRQAAGAPAGSRQVRPAVVLNDPSLSAMQPSGRLAESAANALGHAFEGPLTPLGNPLADAAALAAAGLIDAGSAAGGEPDRAALALGALLAGYVIGATHYGLHHILSQTLARFAGVPHGQANAIMLPVSIAALGERSARAAAWTRRLDAALGTPVLGLAERLRDATARPTLSACGVDGETLERCAEQAAARPELALTPPAPTREELLGLYSRAS